MASFLIPTSCGTMYNQGVESGFRQLNEGG